MVSQSRVKARWSPANPLVRLRINEHPLERDHALGIDPIEDGFSIAEIDRSLVGVQELGGQPL